MPPVKAEQQETPSVTLSNGVKMPCFGFGCAFGDWSSDNKKKAGLTPEDAWTAVPKAFRAGIRHLDTAYVYRTHRQIGTSLGLALRDGLLNDRSEVFITTKVCHPPVPALFGKTFDLVAEAEHDLVAIKKLTRTHILNSLEELGVGWVDMLLVHWPGDFGSDPSSQADKDKNRAYRKVVWEAFEEAYEAGMARAIGVSNFTEEMLADLEADGAKVVPHNNQIEVSPYTQYTKILDYCKAKNIVVSAYSPLGSTAGGVIKDPVLLALGEKYNKNAGQIALKWLVQQGMVALPRSSSEKRIASNMDVFDFEISPEDMAKISSLNKGKTFTNANPYDIA